MIDEETELQRRLRADFPSEFLESRPDLAQLLIDTIATLTTIKRNGYEAGVEESAGVCTAMADEALRIAQSPSMHIDSASRYAARERSLRVAAEKIRTLPAKPAGET